ncbi:hypothetical protein [Actinacidiphila sp. ITFR-21]|uniref:hypothetical protein n=1 Tax=Actinacidiphila sp. ITFR-21 TaxID=3075199 RepID=UPI002889C61F|nr:hypothetical protein [Streptomyces sp. ITFR-21]WNI20245.1 hypothetical protein RLT57_32385 [Streptomyces sp. ITFR-21]
MIRAVIFTAGLAVTGAFAVQLHTHHIPVLATVAVVASLLGNTATVARITGRFARLHRPVHRSTGR